MRKWKIIIFIIIILVIMYPMIQIAIDEMLLTNYRLRQGDTIKDLINEKIVYLGRVDGFRIYHVPHKDDGGILNPEDWLVEGYRFAIPTHIRIKGVKYYWIQPLGKLLFELNIDVEKLHDSIPEKYNKSK